MRRISRPDSARAAPLDTGPLVALFVRGDPDHRHVAAFFKKFSGRLLTAFKRGGDPSYLEIAAFGAGFSRYTLEVTEAREPSVRPLNRGVTAGLGRILRGHRAGEDSMDYRKIITVEPGKRGGKPCIRGLRITVYEILEYLASGMTQEQVLRDFPYLTAEDIQACLAYAADRERHSLASSG